jgi:uncharacterized membrane protein YfhO
MQMRHQKNIRMKNSKKTFLNYCKQLWPIGLILIVVFIFFYPVWLRGKVPIPGDFIVGTYRPWLDYKWGYQVGVPVKNPLTSDVVSVIYPLRSFAVDHLLGGEIPLWIGRMFTGYPLLANFQAAILSPTIIFYFLFAKLDAWSLQVIFQTILSSVFTYLLLRSMKIEKIGSIFGAISYSFGAFSIVWLEWNTHSLTAAWIPLILLALYKYYEEGKFKWGALFSLSICLQLFSGYPQTAFYTWILCIVFCAFYLKELGLKKLFYLGLFGILGIVLSSVQLIPAIELFNQSQRIGELIDPVLRYLPWKNLITLLAPDYFGNPATGNYWGAGNYSLNTAYTGIVTLSLAIFGAIRYRKEKPVKIFLVIIALTLISALKNPISELIYENPALGLSASSPTRMLVLLNFSLAILSAYGIGSLLKRRTFSDLVINSIPLVLLVVCFIMTYFYWRLIFGNFSSIEQLVSTRNLILPLAIALVFGTLLLLRHLLSPKFNRFIIFSLLLLSTVELLRFGWKFTPFSSKSMVFPSTPITDFFTKQENDKPYRVFTGDVIPMNMWVSYGIDSLSGYDAVFPGRWSKLVAALRTKDVNAGAGSRYESFDLVDTEAFDLLNVRYLIAQKYDEKAIPSENGIIYYKYRIDKFEKRFEDKTVAIYENVNFKPRAIMFYDWEVLSEKEILQKLIMGESKLSTTLYLEEKPGDLSITKPGQYYIDWGKRLSNSEELIVTTDRDGLLFVSEMDYPGWEVWVDGVKQKIYRADYAFRSVPIAKGKHKVEFIYSPKSFRIGKWISISAALMLLGILSYEQITKKRPRAS